jgi:hypothetical protein
MYAMRRKRGII